ncbi:hypothetical protein CPB86DRAFT_800669 [Serendipita vermifera]|nr:hypothetical protein CPB86DRAFT_800669 [Serendipita vermifera]
MFAFPDGRVLAAGQDATFCFVIESVWRKVKCKQGWTPLTLVLLSEPCLAQDMPPKRPVSDRSDDDTDENDRVVKKQKTLPHREQFQAVMDEFLDFLTHASSDSLAKFNKRELAAGRWGVDPISLLMFETELGKLQGVTDVAILDTKLGNIDSTLKDFQEQYGEYVSEATEIETSDRARKLIKPSLSTALWGIQEARNRLPPRKPSLRPLRQGPHWE